MQNEQIIEKMLEGYNEDVQKHGINSNAVKWSNPQTQYFRFNELIKNMDILSSKKTLLDLGCGNGELYKYLNFLGARINYTGLDINENLLNQAKAQFKNINFVKADILSDNIEQKFDYVTISGLFNYNVGQDEEWAFKFLEKAFLLSEEVLSFNAISTYVNYFDNEMFYLKPERIFEFCVKNLSKRVSIYHHNLPYNYTVQVFKDENWISI